MKYVIIMLITLTAYCSDTISFSTYQAPKLYNYSYSNSYDRDDDDRYKFDGKYSYNDDKYRHGHPSIPEPSTWSLLLGLCALSAAFVYRAKKLSS